jgi:hypothetical protein
MADETLIVRQPGFAGRRNGVRVPQHLARLSVRTRLVSWTTALDWGAITGTAEAMGRIGWQPDEGSGAGHRTGEHEPRPGKGAVARHEQLRSDLATKPPGLSTLQLQRASLGRMAGRAIRTRAPAYGQVSMRSVVRRGIP